MDLAMQNISNDQTIRSDTVQNLKDFNSQSLATQAKKWEQLVSLMPANEIFWFIGWYHSRIIYPKRCFKK